ncbi:MAG: helix-turn-helix domain-containing protein [Selenomonadaceae bacterium]|nr:helix-turn-helix domain-containing protein [Selenomonadaceae bacterium]
MSIEELIEKAVQKAVKDAVKAEIVGLRKEIQALKAANVKEQKETPARLLQLKEVSERLQISKPKVKELITAGDLRTVTTPGGRLKIVEASLNEYVEKMAN